MLHCGLLKSNTTFLLIQIQENRPSEGVGGHRTQGHRDLVIITPDIKYDTLNLLEGLSGVSLVGGVEFSIMTIQRGWIVGNQELGMSEETTARTFQRTGKVAVIGHFGTTEGLVQKTTHPESHRQRWVDLSHQALEQLEAYDQDCRRGCKRHSQCLLREGERGHRCRIRWYQDAGALQSICFQPEGRRVVRSFGAIPLLIKLLEIPSVNVKARAVGALHNMSSDVYAIRVIRRKGGIRSLVKLLSSDHPKVCGSAAGALQNVSREIVSRLIIRESQARSLLVGLLSNSEVQVQVSAAGALLNVLGPEMNQTCASHDMDRKSRELERKRKAFVRAMTSMLIANIIHDACFASCPSKISYSSHLLKRASETVSKSQDAISTAAL